MNANIFRPANICMILLGNAIMALGIVMFVIPNDLMTGGTTGLSLIVEHYTRLPISLFVLIFNCIMFALGFFALGKAFAMTTLLSTFFYPAALECCQRVSFLTGGFPDCKLLGSLFSGLFIGLALGIVIRSGASTGGLGLSLINI